LPRAERAAVAQTSPILTTPHEGNAFRVAIRRRSYLIEGMAHAAKQKGA